jgi:hypothetical protein
VHRTVAEHMCAVQPLRIVPLLRHHAGVSTNSSGPTRRRGTQGTGGPSAHLRRPTAPPRDSDRMTRPALPPDRITYISTTSTVATPRWAITAPPKSNGAPHLVSSPPNEPIHRSGSSPHLSIFLTVVRWPSSAFAGPSCRSCGLRSQREATSTCDGQPRTMEALCHEGRRRSDQPDPVGEMDE